MAQGYVSGGLTSVSSGQVVQVVNYQTGAVATGTTAIPDDDTIPQITEGNEYMTLAITPNNSSNKLIIDVCVFLSNSTADQTLAAALFQDSTTNALAAGRQYSEVNSGSTPQQIHFIHYMNAGTNSSTTFRVRAGGNTGATTTFNGNAGARKLGGVLASSITITEIKS